ncbi:transcription-repair coupling factor [Paraburkholderia caballeronis]|uniref:Transcription-repair-coupling factor n=1 Tax=Paraburkholderia caballeronis TaxID=416943 RepID=A0A1H7JKD3_9BURK|nr:transcription-repair coupling factor [Paraburkholderia caballeronis]PXW27409.1 transcription-repair coupling factor [Paraburkholderia caballeronis]PXX02883.1 transcription-repair coupling factor [Paraburkholderia caballeronis]RAK03608.1 transcription-repair coupling factor [Paraburkholderia caballeronis]SEC30649.1 transcription-repair coupling factor [Paraburkholderia caballeronis]SEK74430.1 transcription-repair coupling factor [Paraburkholderia caballeronis]
MPDIAASSQSPSPVAVVKPGQRFAFDGTHGSSDALLIARYRAASRPQAPLLAVVCASAVDAQRLAQEIPFFAPDARVRLLPDWETLPYDSFSPHQDLVSERLATLHDLGEGRCDVLLVPATTALYRMPPASFLAAYTFSFKQGERLDEAKLKAQLTLAGYEHVSQVVRPGEYCVRGSLIDLYPMGSPLPYRIDLFDDQVDSIRAFDPDTQRSLYPVKDVRLLPGREFPFDEASRTAFRSRWREVFEGDPSRATIYRDIGNGVPSAGIEYYLPLFFDDTATLFHYLPSDAHLVFCGDLDASIRRFTNDTKQRYSFLSHDRERPILDPQRLFLSDLDFFTLAKPFARLVLPSGAGGWANVLPSLALDRHADDPLAALRAYLDTTPNRVLFAVESAGRRETIAQLFAENRLRPASADSYEDWLTGDERFTLGVAPLSTGFALPGEGLAIVTETELYGPLARRAGRRRQEQASSVDSMVRDLSELKVGDPVVHAQHGIGRYHGLVTMDLGEGETEFLHLEYANGSKLYVPVSQLHVISRYSGADPESAPLHALGSGQWEKARRKAAQQIRDTAAELLNLYARRAAREGHAFKLEPRDYVKFAESFGFEETPDQAAAIAAVIGDMTSGKPMDRLVCGDVGFGKTEVALRAAFIAVMGGRQVAILSPTTLLAEQHTQTFTDRFADWPVRIAELSRFKSTREVNASIQQINDGSVDIVIGTHKLLSSDVQFKRLGLVIIDEEHRFGVRQKEALKALRAEVDVLTLTATPIPRTLGMALEGLRDFSVIATAPQKRLAIKTFVRREEDGVIREAMLRELKRGGQVYFLHNEVETIENRRAMLETLVPEARIAVAHGQMHERELETVMRDFVAQRANVLLCTTIIETGIDVPTANTILIHRSDKFGLAQLHQLRGRVGRSHHQAYAYLLVHDPQGLTKQAQRRLEAIQQMEELGSGFYLAMHDLEIRGTGEVLGDKQSGEIQEIGFQLYTDMLNDAVKALKDGREPDLNAPLAATTEINLHAPAILPADYCGDVQERLSLYKRLANCEHDDSIDAIQEELIDRFGKLPPQAQALIETHRLRLAAKPLGISKIDAGEAVIGLQFIPNPPIDAMRIIEMVQKHKHIKLAGQDKLRIETRSPDLAVRVATVKETLRALGAPARATAGATR